MSECTCVICNEILNFIASYMPKQLKRNGKGRSKSVNYRFKVDTSTANQESTCSNETPHASHCEVVEMFIYMLIRLQYKS